MCISFGVLGDYVIFFPTPISPPSGVPRPLTVIIQYQKDAAPLCRVYISFVSLAFSNHHHPPYLSVLHQIVELDEVRVDLGAELLRVDVLLRGAGEVVHVVADARELLVSDLAQREGPFAPRVEQDRTVTDLLDHLLSGQLRFPQGLHYELLGLLVGEDAALPDECRVEEVDEALEVSLRLLDLNRGFVLVRS